MAMLTIMGMYDYDNTIFDSLVLPLGLDRNTAIDEIVLECAELECIYPSVPFFKRAVGIWSATMQSSFVRVWNAINLEYNPIENYDRQEDETTTGTRQHSGQDVTSGTSSNQRTTSDSKETTDSREITDSGNVLNKIAGFDASALVDHDSGTSSRTGTDSASGTESTSGTENASGTERTELTHGEKIADAGTRTSRIHGNIGMITSQQMLESELDLVPRLNFCKWLAEEFKKRFCILVY